MAPKGGINVRVLTMDTELEFTIQNKTTGKLLFDQVIQTTGLREHWYFGLHYTDVKGVDGWLSMDKKVAEQKIKKEATLQFKFRVKYFPENVVDEIIQSSTLRLLYLQVRSAILSEAIHCPAEKAVLLASFGVQAKYGNQEPEVHEEGYLASDSLLPAKVISEHKLTREEWEAKIAKFHAKHSGMSRPEAMAEYLKVAQDLETYGISYYDITNKKGSELSMGVDCLGINIYNRGERLSPKINFPWSEINRISYQNSNFIVKLTDKKSPKFVGICADKPMSKKVYELASGNHEMYIRRRRPDTLEVQQMKSQKKDEEATRDKDKASLAREVAARAKAEQLREEMAAKFKEMEKRMASREGELEEAQGSIRRLEEQLGQLREAKEELEGKQEQLSAMIVQLEEAKNMEYEERARMEEEIRAKQEEIADIRAVVDSKEAETRELQEEVTVSRQKLEETSQSLAASMADAQAAQRQSEAEAAQRQAEAEAALQRPDSSASSCSGEQGAIVDIPAIIVDPVDDREVDMDPDMSSELAELGKDLESARDEAAETEETRAHRENVRTGKDKYKTLREVRKGNTKRRIDNFENM